MDKPIQSFQIAKNIKVIAWLYSKRERTTKEETNGCESIDFVTRGMESQQGI